MTTHRLLLAVAPEYQPVFVLLLVVVAAAAVMLILAHSLGPRRIGPQKHAPYESGMPVASDARRRFNVRFYMVAVLFLLFEVEVIFLWPWSVLFHHAAMDDVTVGAFGTKGFLFAEMAIFMLILLIGYIYEWRTGAFRWD